MSANLKTNAMRILDKHKIAYKDYVFTADSSTTGMDIATILGENPAQVFKTLVTTGKTGNHYVFMVPVAEELDLKKAALAVGEKYVEMLKQKDLLPLTGYVHGGCSPIGMKKQFKTVAHITAENFPTIFFSAGAVGHQVELPISALKTIIPLITADIIA